MRGWLLVPVVLLLLAAAPPAKPAPPPTVGVKAVNVRGVARCDVVLPGHAVATAFPRGTDGRRRIVVLVDRELWLVDTAGAGSLRRLLADLPEKASVLTAAALGDRSGGGAEEMLLAAPGVLWALGTPDAPTAPRALITEPGLDPHHILLKAGLGGLATAELGRLRTWTVAGSQKPAAETSFTLPVRATRERTALRLDTPEVEVLPESRGGAPLYLAGPEENGKLRLRTLLLTRDAEGKPQQTEAWSRFSTPESVDHHWFVRVDGVPLLLVTTTDGEKVSVFGKERLRVFQLVADRSRAGHPPLLAAPTVSHRWFPVAPAVLDLDRDGHEDLVVVQHDGLAGKSLVAEVFFGRGGGRFELPGRKVSLDVEARALAYGPDVTGDGRPDLVAVQKDQLLVFAGAADPRREPFERRPRLTIPLPPTGETVVTASAGSEGGSVDAQNSVALQILDLDGDGRGEAVLTLPEDQRHGRMTVVRLNGPFR